MANLNFGPVVISEANTDPFRYVKPLPRGEIREKIFRSYVYLPKRQFGVAFFKAMQTHPIIGCVSSLLSTYSNTASDFLCDVQESHILYVWII